MYTHRDVLFVCWVFLSCPILHYSVRFGVPVCTPLSAQTKQALNRNTSKYNLQLNMLYNLKDQEKANLNIPMIDIYII